MVKIHDPRADRAAISMRSLRASTANKCLKSIIKKNKIKNENKLIGKNSALNKLDSNFCEDFNLCEDSIKQELIFLWEEVGDLNSLVDQYEAELKKLDSIQISISDSDYELPPPPLSPPPSPIIKTPIQKFKKNTLFGP